jgi:hypothetical protein
VGGTNYVDHSLIVFLRKYRVHGIFDVATSGDHILGLHDPKVECTGKEKKMFQRRKSRVKKLYSYAKAASIQTHRNAYNLLFVRSKDNPTPLHTDADFIVWEEKVEAAASQVATAVHEKILKTKQSLGITTKRHEQGVLKVGATISNIEAINTAQTRLDRAAA